MDNRAAVLLQGLSDWDTLRELLGQRRAAINFQRQAKNSLYCLHDEWASEADTKYSVLPLNGNTFFKAIIHDI